jgi:flagellar biosynthesis protein FlhG
LLDSALSGVNDQAAGLRRLFGNRPPPVVAFVSGRDGSGRTTLLIRAAASLARSGQRVIVVDENSGSNSAISTMRIKPSGDLLESVAGKVPLKQLLKPVEPQLWAIRAEKAAAMLRTDTPGAAEAAELLIDPLRATANFVLIDSRVHGEGHLSLLSARATHMVVVVAARPDAITTAYTVIKRLARERGRDGFHMVITRARSENDAAAIFNNVRRTAHQHLGVRVDYLGNYPVPETADLADSLQGGMLLAPAFQ